MTREKNKETAPEGTERRASEGNVSRYSVERLKETQFFAMDRYLLDLLDASREYSKEEAVAELNRLRKQNVKKEGN